MEKSIEDLADRFPLSKVKQRKIPMPKLGYLVKEYDCTHINAKYSRFLEDKNEISDYMSIVGCLIWIQGIRMDIIFAVLYLSWHTRAPRSHHMEMALYCVGYLYFSKTLPLVLGGTEQLQLHGYTDASLGTGPKSKSILGTIAKLNENAAGGAIISKASAGQCVSLSSFEAELDGTARLMKIIARINNILEEMHIKHIYTSQLYSDNEAMINFVRGEGVAKGVRHMELRMWYVREQYQKGNIILNYMPGEIIPTDKLTKLGTTEEHKIFRDNILGLNLLVDNIDQNDENVMSINDEEY
eukprot:gene18206-25611_t